MARRGFDRGAAAAEARLERLDDAAIDDGRWDDGAVLASPEDGAAVVEDDSIHIEADWFAEVEGDDAPDPADHTHSDLADCIDTFAEAFNARDLDGALELVTPDCESPGLGNDVAHFPEALEDLWERRPNILLTRGILDDEPVGVAWELGESGSGREDGWWPVATVHFSDVVDGRAGVLAFSTDPGLLDAVATDAPDRELEQGTRWSEWDEGAAD